MAELNEGMRVSAGINAAFALYEFTHNWVLGRNDPPSPEGGVGVLERWTNPGDSVRLEFHYHPKGDAPDAGKLARVELHRSGVDPVVIVASEGYARLMNGGEAGVMATKIGVEFVGLARAMVDAVYPF